MNHQDQRNRQKLIEKVTKSFYKKIKIGLVIGTILIVYGIIKFFYIGHNLSVNLKTQLLSVSNGALPIVAGLATIIGVYLSVRRSKSIIDSEVDSIIKEEERENQHF